MSIFYRYSKQLNIPQILSHKHIIKHGNITKLKQYFPRTPLQFRKPQKSSPLKTLGNICLKVATLITAISEPLDCGTRPFWDAEKNCLYFVDVENSVVYKYNLCDQKVSSAKVGDEPLAFMIPVQGYDDQFIAALGRKLVFVQWDGESPFPCKIELITEVEFDAAHKSNRFNDGKVDPCGRLWAGTMGPKGPCGDVINGRGALYSFSKGTILKHETNIGASNGLAWNSKEHKLYFVDTLDPGVYQYEYNASAGEICGKTKIFDFKENNIEGFPGGLTIDTKGYLWVAAINGSCIVQFNPKDGKVKRIIDMPTEQVTAVTFGGKKLEKLFVTTARMPVDGIVPDDCAGRTYVIDHTGSRGHPGHKYKCQ